MRKHRGTSAPYPVLEDNDPSGYKANVAKDAKRALSIRPIEFAGYSPDLYPLDYFLWSEIERRMAKQREPANETVEAYKLRLKHVAKAIPASVIKAAVAKIKSKACEVVKAGGGKIRSD